ncbi:hypothetical protein QR680_004095 [Steinernema hermaphroditum]|uniref:BZIP domain-containing protein n=1 Tax=Steinernema hermaphroditum TaxID=289476 RepID=A0AA39LTF4_9BILA|nr:hypothetical protein QR680_004095 [Steinernema hermaphroditum]
MYQQLGEESQLHFDSANSPSVSDILQLEDWSLPEGNDFSLDSTLYNNHPVMTGSSCTQTTPPSGYDAPFLQPKVEPSLMIQPKAEPSSSLYDYPAPSPAAFEEKPLVAKHRKLASQRAAEERDSVGPVRRRGRPSKATSNSKSAQYAREYRVQNKKLLEEYRQQVETLIERNRVLEENQSRMSENYVRLQEEFEEVQEVNRKLQSEIVPAVSQILQSGAQPCTVPLKSGVCIHLSQNGISLKSCDHCQILPVNRPTSSQSCRDTSMSNLPFDGDFSFVEQYLC